MTVQFRTTNESSKFIHDLIWVAISQVFTTLLGIITLPVLTKKYTSETYGVWTQVNVTVGLLVTVVTLQFVTAVVRFLAGEDDKDKRRRSTGAMLYTILVFAFLIVIVTNLWASQLSILLFNDPVYSTLVRLTSLLACLEALFAFFIAHLRAMGKMKKLSVIQAALAASKIGLITILVSSGIALQWLITGMICVDLIFVLYLLRTNIRDEGFPIPDFTGLKVFLAFSIPQIPVSIFAWIMSGSDRYFITHYFNLSETGIYSSSSSLGALIALFYFPIGYVLFPAASKTWEQNRKTDTKAYFEYSTRLFLTLAVPAAVGISMISQQLLRVLATSEYLAGIELVLLISISQLFWGIFQINEYIIYLVKQTKWLPLIMVISAVTSIVLNLILIPHAGMTGAAISKIVTYFLLAAIVTIWTKRVLKYNIDFKYIAKIAVASLTMAICLHFLKIGGLVGVILSVIVGVFVFFLAMLSMKAFTEQDKRLLNQIFRGVSS